LGSSWIARVVSEECAGSTIPSNVELCDIKSVEVDDKGQLKLIIPRHVDIVLPLGIDDANRLANELKDLIP